MVSLNKKYFFILSLAFIWISTNTLLSQTLSLDSTFLKNFSSAPDVPFSRINDILQTSDRYLWIATPEGLFRYDGFHFKSISLPDSSFYDNVNIRTLFEDSQKNIWIGTEKGVLIRYSNGKWDSITSRSGLSNEHIRCITEDLVGNIWIGTDYGLNKISSNGIEIFNTNDGMYDNIITTLSVDIHGFLWIGTLRGGVTQFKEGVIHTFSYEDGLLNPSVYSLVPDKLGNIWIGTMRGLYKLNPLTRLITPEYYLNYTPITSLCINDGILFIGTMADGIKSIENDGLLFFNTDNGLPDDYVTSLLIDDYNNLWCGMDVGGLVSLNRPLLFNLTEKNGLPKDVITSLLQTESGRVLIGTRMSGLYTISSLNEKLAKHSETGLLNNPVTSLFEDTSKKIWVGTEIEGIKIVDGNRSINLTEAEGLLSNSVRSIHEDQQGVVWIGTDNGLNSYSENEITGSYLIGESINFIGEENNELYTGTTNGFIKRNIETGNFTTIFSGFSLISHHKINNKGTFLFGTEDSGILFWKNGDLKICSILHGLPENTIFSITQTDNLNFWISSPKGIFTVRQNILNGYLEGNINYITAFQLNELKAMPSSFYGNGQYSVIVTADGEFYYPTGEGISYFNPTGIKFPDSTGQIIIENIFLDDEAVKEVDNLLIESTVDKILIEFTIPDLLLSNQFYFRYKIDSDTGEYKYIKPSEERTVIFDNPGTGKYNLLLQAANVNGEWEKNSVIIPFRIESPFYTKSWFLLIVAILMFSLYYVNMYIEKQKKIREKENKYKTLNIDIDRKRSAADKLVKLMEDEKLFLDPNLTLQQLAKRINLHYNHLSRIINEMFGVSFNDFINRYRIEEAKKKLKDPENASENILEILYSCGFYSKSVFNTAFKKFTGKTPSQYRKSG